MTHHNNISRYRQLLKTILTDHEREFIQRRLAEEQSAVQTLAHISYQFSDGSTLGPAAEAEASPARTTSWEELCFPKPVSFGSMALGAKAEGGNDWRLSLQMIPSGFGYYGHLGNQVGYTREARSTAVSGQWPTQPIPS